MVQPAISAITMALASASSSFNVPGGQPKTGIAGFTAVAKHAHGLPPTPPNSLSPSILPHDNRMETASPPPVHLDHDMNDNQDVQHSIKAEVHSPQLLTKEALFGLEREQAITSGMLARDYLPTIMLGNGDMAIRHIMACLNNEVQGFARLDPSKARRTVVGALESPHGGGVNGTVQFAKVGWGRWTAHIRDQKPSSRTTNSFSRSRMSPSGSESSFVASHSGSSYPIAKRRRPSNPRGNVLGQSFTASDMPSLDEGLEDMSMSDHEVDNMSLDGSSSDSDSNSAGDETDEEDWATMGAAALRRRQSKTVEAPGSLKRNYNLLSIPGPAYARQLSSTTSTHRRSSTAHVASSAPVHNFISDRIFSPNTFNESLHAIPLAMNIDTQERDAARALLSLGSM